MKRTALYERHRSSGARFVEFGGWEMPVQYSSIIEEHRTVRQQVGLFDVSHMGQVEVRGSHAIAALQRVTVNDVSRLSDGEAQYSLLCHPSGGVVDDIIIYRLAENRFFICLNASNTEKDLAWLREHCHDADVVDRSADYALLALQGPRATEVLSRLMDQEIAAVPRFACREWNIIGHPVLAARTGYTGEDGWELYCKPGDAIELWDTLLEAGHADGIRPAGLGARDTLRLEAALPLYGHELDDETTPLEAGLGWAVRFDKGDFIGREALLRQKSIGVTRKLAGIVLTEPGIPRQGYAILHEEKHIGIITSGAMSPTLGKGIGLGYVAASCASAGTTLSVQIRGRQVRGKVVTRPFYKR